MNDHEALRAQIDALIEETRKISARPMWQAFAVAAMFYGAAFLFVRLLPQ